MTGLKGIRIVGFLAMAMGLVVALMATAESLVRLQSPSASEPAVGALVPVSLAFLAIGVLAGMAGVMFKMQASQISDLRRQLDDAKRAN